MKCLALLLLAIAGTITSAEECPITAPVEHTGPPNPVVAACPSIYSGPSFNPADPTTITTESLKLLEPCKEATCITEFKKLTPPDCTVNNVNMKASWEATLKLCEAFNAGPVTVEAAKAILEPVFKDYKEQTFAPNATTTAPPTTTKPTDSATAPTPAPTTTPKSGASGALVTGAAVIVVVTAIQWLA